MQKPFKEESKSFQQMVLEQLDIHMQKKKKEPLPKHHILYKINSKRIIDLEEE